MSSKFNLLLFFFLLNIFAVNLIAQDKGDLILNIENTTCDKGVIWIGVYDSADTFMDQSKAVKVIGLNVNNKQDLTNLFSGIKETKIITKAGQKIIQFTISNLPYKEYAISLFHDEDLDGNLNSNFVGIPTEPYGFSVKPVSKWRMPRYKELTFDFLNNQQELNIELERW